ncbi:MAG: hypothetical protein QXI19_06390 [Candidatus Caldarchaeum sp.]
MSGIGCKCRVCYGSWHGAGQDLLAPLDKTPVVMVYYFQVEEQTVSERQCWVPYLSDNVYRLTGLGSRTSLIQLRQAAKRIEAGLKVGIVSEVPLSTLLGDEEIKNLSNHIRQISADAVKLVCHKLMWFLDWSADDIDLQDINQIAKNVRRDTIACQIQSEFLEHLLRFISSHAPEELQESVLALDEWYSDDESDHYLTELVAREINLPLSQAQEILHLAQQIVAKAVLGVGVEIAIAHLESGDFSHGKDILTTIVDSPLEDDWEDAVLAKVSDYVLPIVSRIREAARTYRKWSPDSGDPHAHDCEKIMSLVNLLRGRVTQVIEWESVVQGWVDNLAMCMCNYAVERVNEILERLPLLQHSSDYTKIDVLMTLRTRLLEAQGIIKQALNKRTSNEVKQHLTGTLRETQLLIDQIPPLPASTFPGPYHRSPQDRPFLSPVMQKSHKPDPVESCILSILYRAAILVVVGLLFGICSWFNSCSNSEPSSSSAPYSSTTTSSGMSEYLRLQNEADLLYNSHKYSEAARSYAKVIRLARENNFLLVEDIYYKYGVALERSRNRSTAIWAYQTYLQRNQNGTYTSDALKRLTRLGIVSRPQTGRSVFGKGIYAGYSEIIIDNQTDRDAVVKIMQKTDRSSKMIRDLYVRSNSRAIARQVPAGTYFLKVAYGVGWHKKQRKFLTNRSFSKSELFTVEQYHTGYSIQYSQITITLHKVYDGNFSFVEMSESEF